jgi:hypothetical protein
MRGLFPLQEISANIFLLVAELFLTPDLGHGRIDSPQYANVCASQFFEMPNNLKIKGMIFGSQTALKIVSVHNCRLRTVFCSSQRQELIECLGSLELCCLP